MMEIYQGIPFDYERKEEMKKILEDFRDMIN